MVVERSVRSVWHLFDAKGQVTGRLASRIATLLIGKNKPDYVPRNEGTDTVVVLNADQVVLTGRKWQQKLYRHHTGYPGGLKSFTAEKLAERKPLRDGILYMAVKGMLPKNRLRTGRLRRLRLYSGTEHPHAGVFGQVKLPSEQNEAPIVKHEMWDEMDEKMSKMQPRRLYRPNKKPNSKIMRFRKTTAEVIMPEDLLGKATK